MPGTEGLPHALRRSAPQAGPRTVVGLFPQYLQLLPNCARRSERPEVPQPDSCTAANTRLRAMLERLKDTTGSTAWQVFDSKTGQTIIISRRALSDETLALF